MRTENRARGLRVKLVNLLKRKGISHPGVLSAFMNLPRHKYMPEASLEWSYKDVAYPIGADQTISQPYTVAVQTTLLDPQPSDIILEVGTGSGFQASVLSYLGAKVYSIERQLALFEATSMLLDDLGYGHIRTLYGDGYKGAARFAPFDKIIITCGASTLPKALFDQLKVGGILVIPYGPDDEKRMLRIIKQNETDFSHTEHGTFSFVPFLQGTSDIIK